MIDIFIHLAASFITALLGTLIVRRYALHKRLVDIPNERTSHANITPRGGGLSIVVSFTLFTTIWLFYTSRSGTEITIIVAITAAVLVAVVGFIDDHTDLSALVRLISHFVAASIVLIFIDPLPHIRLYTLDIGYHPLLYPFYALLIVWVINLYNFMDGIDGIASIEALTTLFGASLILWLNAGDSVYLPMMSILAASIAGFLVWNWPPAKIFMGDVCSGFLGFVLAVFAVLTAAGGDINIWAWLILLGVFIVDATYTLIYRVIVGEKWYAPHRSHAYQILSRHFGSHKSITVSVLLINLVWLLPLAYMAASYENYAAIITLISYLPLLILSVAAKITMNRA